MDYRQQLHLPEEFVSVNALPDKAEGFCTDGHCYFLKLRTKTISGYMMYYSPEVGKRLADLRDGVFALINAVYDTSDL